MPEKILLLMSDISKVLGSKLLFKNLFLELKEGEGALLTGANGSGKSTLLRIAAGLSKPDQGKIERNSSARFAFLGHMPFLYPGLTALENLAFWQKADCSPAEGKAPEELLDLLGLLPYAHNQVRNFSKGMTQRLNFARVFLRDPHLFLLDEPFSGIDRDSRQIILNELLERKKKGAAILTVSHDPEVDGILADRIYLLEKKRLKLEHGLQEKTEAGRMASR